MRITRMKVNHLTNPLGFELSHPVLTWVTEDAQGTVPESARIRISEHPDLSSPLLDTGDDPHICSLGYPVSLPQKPRTRYYWQVTVRSDMDEVAVSPIAWYETAKLNEPWTASWIGRDACVRRPVYEKTLSLSAAPIRARLYITGLGLYDATVDGARVSDEFLMPGCNNYPAWVQYQTYDVTHLVHDGAVLRVALSDGWYKGRFGFKGHEGGHYGDDYRLLCELHLLYADGTEQVIGTDESWLVRSGNLVASSIYDGECLDATLPDEPPAPAALCDAPTGQLTPRLSPPVTVHTQLTPTLLITPKGEQVLDLGQNMAGTFRMRVHEPRGTRIFLQFGEVLQDGCFYRENLRSAKSEYTFVSDGEEHILLPVFSFWGGRYVKVEGIARLHPEDFTGLPLTTQLEDIGALTTGHPLVNRLISNIRWSLLDNFIDVPTDCPQRDERMGWTGDAQVFAPTACLLRDTYAFYRKYLYDMATEQAARGGMVPDVVPAFDLDGCSSVWGDATTIIPWELYRKTGDSSILREHFPAMKAWVDYIRRLDGDSCHWRDVFHYGDWLALDVPGAPADNVRGDTDEAFLADVHYMYSAEIVADAAALLGYAQDAEAYRTLARRVRERIRSEFYTVSGRCALPTQTGLLLTLRHRLADEEVTLRALRRRMEKSGYKLQTGFVGTPILCQMLSRHGMHDLAASLLLSEEAPGWLFAVRQGATTIWERWNSLDENGRMSSTGMNSLNHYSYGSVYAWMAEHLAGLQNDTPGYAHTSIAPKPVRALGSLDFTYRSASGTWRIAWAFQDGSCRLSLTVPFGCTATLTLPFTRETVPLVAGQYEYVLPA